MIKAIILTLLYTSIYAINCNDFISEFSKIEKNTNKVLKLTNSMGEIIFFIQDFLALAYITNSNILVAYDKCVPEIPSILFTNSDLTPTQQILYNVDLTNDSKIVVSDFFEEPDLEGFKKSSSESYKQNLIISRTNPEQAIANITVEDVDKAISKSNKFITRYNPTISQVSYTNPRKRHGEEHDKTPSSKKQEAMSSTSLHSDIPLPWKLTHDLKNAHISTDGYKILYEIPPKIVTNPSNTLIIDALNQFLVDLKQGQNIVLLSKEWFHNEEKVRSNSLIYLIITKINDSLYHLRRYYKNISLDTPVSETVLRFILKKNDYEGFSYILITNKYKSLTGVGGFYILSNDDINTKEQFKNLDVVETTFKASNQQNEEEQSTKLDDRNIAGVYHSTDDILNKFFNNTPYNINQNYKESDITKRVSYLNELISSSKESFVLINQDYFEQKHVNHTNRKTIIGILIEPITLSSIKVFKFYYIDINDEHSNKFEVRIPKAATGGFRNEEGRYIRFDPSIELEQTKFITNYLLIQSKHLD